MAEKTVEQRCYEALKARGVTFAAAESCTGGLIAKRITDVPRQSSASSSLPMQTSTYCIKGFMMDWAFSWSRVFYGN